MKISAKDFNRLLRYLNGQYSMKRYSPPLIIREMKIKITMWYLYISNKMAKIRKLKLNIGTFLHCWEERKVEQLLLKLYGSFLKGKNILTIRFINSSFRNLFKINSNTSLQKDCGRISITSLFMIVLNWK